MGSILKHLPRGQKVALAFSGGLDTRTATQWMSENEVEVYCYTADLGQPDEPDIQSIPKIAYEYGAKKAVVLDCREAIANEGMRAIQCGAFHVQSGGLKYYNTTPIGRAVTTKAIMEVMKKDGVSIFGDGSTHRGNDIQRFFRYAKLFYPEVQIYKPWLDPAFVKMFGGRKEMAEYLEKKGKPYKASVEKAYSTDSNILGATHEAKDLEYLDKSLKIVEPIMGVPFWRDDFSVKKEEVEIEFQEGIVVSINDERFSSMFEMFKKANEIAGRHGLGICDMVENRVIDAKSRGVYEAPGMALIHIAYERLLQIYLDEDAFDLYFHLGRKLGRLLYEGKWYDFDAEIIKESLFKMSQIISGKVLIELDRGNNYIILRTEAKNGNYHPELLSMEKTASLFTEEDRIGQLEIQNLSLYNNRNLKALLKRYTKT
ncbi:MAG: argininosuccinate synthase [Leptospiraceae bacterium]|nr:argininosuccinate synthase [Leptospiraceae bacterium]MDW7976219.1 argininosuccinate synthase [Leptospiraceae bacterium]